MSEKRYTLHTLNALVREAIAAELPDEYWVEAELSECRESRGHCYMELVEKDETSNTPVAKASAKCWKQTWAMVQPYFERTTGQPLRAGMKVLLKVYPQFHEAFGFSWIVTDIDPNYTLGDMAQRRQQIIAQLKAEGVFDLQRELVIPRFCQRTLSSLQQQRQDMVTSAASWRRTNTDWCSTPPCFLLSCKVNRWNRASLLP